MKRFIYMVFVLVCSFQLHAQENNQQKLEALRIAFFTKQLNLSPQEAQKFWPVYNKYQHDLQDLVVRQRNGQIKPAAYDKEMSSLRTHYRGEFVKAVGQAKFNRLLNAERNWGEMLKSELKRRGQNPNPGRGQGPQKKVGPPTESKGPPPHAQGNRGKGRGN